GQRGRHQGEPVAGLRGLPGPVESPSQRPTRQVSVGQTIDFRGLSAVSKARMLTDDKMRSSVPLLAHALTMTSRSRSFVRKNFTLSNFPNSFSRLRLLYNCAGRRIPCRAISSEFNWAIRNV